VASLERVRFLVVDDNVHMIRLVKTLLKGFGVQHVFEAKSIAEGLAHLRGGSIDIVILDYVIGSEDGVDFARQVRNNPDSPAPFIPIVMLTAHSERTRVEGARDAGVNEFCAKPVTASELFRKVAAMIDHPRAYVSAPAYHGPDRRRRDDPSYAGEERRADRKPQPDG
jgi:two-component system chemotaxis response regulator CheY